MVALDTHASLLRSVTIARAPKLLNDSQIADYIQYDPSTRSHATERIMIGLAHRCLVSLEATAAA